MEMEAPFDGLLISTYILYFRKEISPCLTDSFSFGLEKIVSAFHISCRPALCPSTLIRFKIRWFMTLCPSTGTSRHSPSLKSILCGMILNGRSPTCDPANIHKVFFKKHNFLLFSTSTASVTCFLFKRQQNHHIDSTRFPSGPHCRRGLVVHILK